MNNDINNNNILHTNPNINISNLNETKDDFFSGNNNNLSSFLNTNKQNKNVFTACQQNILQKNLFMIN